MVRDKADLRMISETKLDSSFPNAQIYLKSYSKPYRLDRNSKGEGIVLYVREEISSKLINSSCTNHEKEYFLVELNLRKQKYLIICNYNPHKTTIKGHLECISKYIDSHSSKYGNFLLLGDFNSKPTEEAMKSFCQIYNSKNLLGKPTSYKNPTNPLCVDLILTNKPRRFHNSWKFKTGLSDFHKMTLTVLKSSFVIQKLKILNYRNYKFFNNTLFRDQVLNKLINLNFQISDKGLKHFKETCLSVVNTIAPLRSRSIRANQAPFINKEIQGGVMVTSKLRKTFAKVDSKVTKNHIINKEINALVY